MRSALASAKLRCRAVVAAALALAPSVAAFATTLRWEQPATSPPVEWFRVYKGPSVEDAGEQVFEGLPTPDSNGIYSVDVQIDEIDQGVPVYVWLTAGNGFGESDRSNVKAFPGCDRLLDADCDGVPDDGAPGNLPCATGQTVGCDDNCRYAPNAGQDDTGGIGGSSGPDGIGDECQCGDVNGNGSVTLSDSLIIRYSLVTPPLTTMARPDLCDVGSSPGCTLTDATIVRWAQVTPPAATIQQVCAPALAP
jgi:hypothetical protein